MNFFDNIVSVASSITQSINKQIVHDSICYVTLFRLLHHCLFWYVPYIITTKDDETLFHKSSCTTNALLYQLLLLSCIDMRSIPVLPCFELHRRSFNRSFFNMMLNDCEQADVICLSISLFSLYCLSTHLSSTNNDLLAHLSLQSARKIFLKAQRIYRISSVDNCRKVSGKLPEKLELPESFREV